MPGKLRLITVKVCLGLGGLLGGRTSSAETEQSSGKPGWLVSLVGLLLFLKATLSQVSCNKKHSNLYYPKVLKMSRHQVRTLSVSADWTELWVEWTVTEQTRKASRFIVPSVSSTILRPQRCLANIYIKPEWLRDLSKQKRNVRSLGGRLKRRKISSAKTQVLEESFCSNGQRRSCPRQAEGKRTWRGL